MGFFNENLFRPLRPTGDKDENNDELSKKLSLSKEQSGYKHFANILNKKIDSGENTGEYEEDKLSQKITQLEKERGSLLSDDAVSSAYKNLKEFKLLQADIPELMYEIDIALLNRNNDGDDYTEKIKILDLKEKELRTLLEEIENCSEETKIKAYQVLSLDEEIGTYTEQHKKAFKNQNIKTVQGQYLN